MQTIKPNIDEVALTEFAKRHRLSELSIFGSILRDDFGPESDVDVLFALIPGEMMTIEKYLEMQDELEHMFGRPVHTVRRELVTNPYRRANILRTRRIVYAA